MTRRNLMSEYRKHYYNKELMVPKTYRECEYLETDSIIYLPYDLSANAKGSVYNKTDDGYEKVTLRSGTNEVNYRIIEYIMDGSATYRYIYHWYVPVYRVSDKVKGLYDLITDEFTTVTTVEPIDLPDEYQQVEYLESTGTEYVGTGIIIQNSVINEVELDAYGSMVIGNGGSTYAFTLSYSKYGNKRNIYYCCGYSTDTKTVSTSNIGRIKTQQINGEFYVDNISYGSVPTQISIANPYEIFLFRDRNSYGRGKIYKAVLVVDDIKHTFVPCYRKEDGLPGMYEIETGELHTNIGSGEFLIGKPVTEGGYLLKIGQETDNPTRDLDANDYIKDGLVFQLDADDFNGGSTWTDRIGGVVFENHGATKSDKQVNFEIGNYLIAPQNLGYAWKDCTIEAVFKMSSHTDFWGCIFIDGGIPENIVLAYNGSNITNTARAAAGNGNAVAHPLSTKCFISTNYGECYKNGVYTQLQERSGNYLYSQGTKPCVGARNGANTYFEGYISAIRIYNRHLTTDEKKYNQEIDIERFGLE